MSQAQVEEFEKKLTAVHTKGLENVENEEREQQLEEQKKTPVPKRARRPTRGNTTHCCLSKLFISHTLWAADLFIEHLQQLISNKTSEWLTNMLHKSGVTPAYNCVNKMAIGCILPSLMCIWEKD